MQGFEILGKLGEGAYSNVYKVRRKADDHFYALKQVKLLTLNDKERANSLNEVRLLARAKPFSGQRQASQCRLLQRLLLRLLLQLSLVLCT